MKNRPPVMPECQRLVEDHLPLIRWVVQAYISYNESAVGLEFDDLCQEGAVALCHAAATYKAGKTAFSTYAVKVIRNHLISYCRDIARGMRNIPAVPLEEREKNERDHQNSSEFEDGRISGINASEILNRRKTAYKGTARRGIEALEIKVMLGYGVTDIAKLYGAKPNLIGAWISKATKLMRGDLTNSELEILGVEELAKTA